MVGYGQRRMACLETAIKLSVFVLDATELATPSLLTVPEETALILKLQLLPLQLKTSLVTTTSYHLSVILLVPKNL